MAQQRVLIIGKVWPEPNSSAAGIRMLQLLQFFLNEGYSLHFCSAAKQGPYSANLEALGITCSTVLLNDTSFDAFVKELQPHITLFDRFTTEEQFGWRVHQQCPDSFLLLDTEDLHSLRSDREQTLKKKTEPEETSTITLRELSSIFRCDASIIISKTEFDFLQNQYQVPADSLIYLPLLNESPKALLNLPFEQRHHFISIGNFLHAPNKDSVLYLRDAIWPFIHKQLPNAEMHVYGAYADDAIIQWTQKQRNFFVFGRAENAEQVMQEARVCLAPLRFGAGQKGKLLLAMQCGTPSVTTHIGAESMCEAAHWPGAIADTPENFAEKAISLYQSKESWQTAADKIERALQAFDKKQHLAQFKVTLNHLLENKLAFRKKNIVGQLLRHHANHSTRYMALWIEAKNKIEN